MADWPKIIAVFNRVLAQAAGGLLFLLLILICANVFMRYAIGNPINWVDQITGYFLVYFTFLGAPWVLASRGHVAVEVVHDKLPPGPRLWSGRALDLAGFVYSVLFTYLGILECMKLVSSESAFVDVIEVPQVAIYWVIPVGSTLLALQFLVNLLEPGRAHPQKPDTDDRSALNG